MTKYSELLADWLVDLGYTHCFFVAGGNIMHLLESCSRRFTCVPVVHEVAAGIAAEYFNEVHLGGKAFALVTAGPGLTNIVTALAGAYLESRELLVIGGQVKMADCRAAEVRQRGIQEIDGVAIAAPVTVRSELIASVIDRATFASYIRSGRIAPPQVPCFSKYLLDIQAAPADEVSLTTAMPGTAAGHTRISARSIVEDRQRSSRRRERPVILLGAGITRDTAHALLPSLEVVGRAVDGDVERSDRMPADHPCYFGRPNTWGQRYANVLLQQADLLLALGTRLSLQQTGFNWQQFVPVGEVVHVDCDSAELSKGHPAVASQRLRGRQCRAAVAGRHELYRLDPQWLEFCREVQQALPLVEPGQHHRRGLSFAVHLRGTALESACTAAMSSFPAPAAARSR